MEAQRWEQIQAIFALVAEMPPNQQRAKVHDLCGNDLTLVESVLDMLEEDARHQHLIDADVSRIADVALHSDHIRSLIQRQIGPYRLLRVLGEGGMGIVYLAERTDIGGLVAIKLLRDAWLSPMRRERFAFEQQTLVKLNHPSIARIYDANTMEDGTPWFVMEYADGQPLTAFLKARGGTLRDDLLLFRRVCEAVQFAHSHAIIHRDLKPSNILVTAEGKVKLLDFGIAKQINMAEKDPQRTTDGLRLYTDAYAAPEQRAGGDVGVFTDVYALGALLYEVLTGQKPLTEEEREGRPLDKPSSLVRKAGVVPPRLQIGKHAWSELDLLCLTALQAEPKLRYGTVEALHNDITAYLEGHVLQARPPSFVYTAQKFTRRNRLPLATIAAALLLIVGTTVWFTVRLSRARNTAVAEAARTQRIQRFMLDMLGNADGEAAPSNDLKVVTLLDRSAQGAAALDADPQTQLDLYVTLGTMYDRLVKFEKSNQLLSTALAKAKQTTGDRSTKVASILIQLGTLLGDREDAANAQKDLQQAIDIAKANHLAVDDPLMVEAQVAMGKVQVQSGSYQKAIDTLTPITQIAPDRGRVNLNDLRDSVSFLAVAHVSAHNYNAAEASARRAIDMDRQLLGGSHVQTGMDIVNLASVKTSMGDYPEAERLYREGIPIMSAWYGPGNPDVVTAMSILARTLIAEKKNQEAEVILNQVLHLQEEAYGPVNQRIAYTLNSLGELMRLRGDLPKAEADYSRALAIDHALLGDQNYMTAAIKGNLGAVYLKESQPALAEPLLRDAVSAIAVLPPGNNLIGTAHARWGSSLLALKRYPEAERELTSAEKLLAAQKTPPPAEVQNVHNDLGTLYLATHQAEKARLYQTESSR